MATLLIASPEERSGKSAIAAGLSRKLTATDVQEAPAGELPSGNVIVVVTPATDPAATAACAGSAPVIVNRANPRKLEQVRAAYEAAGVKVIGVVPEDHVLATPSIGEVAAALEATGEFIDENKDAPLDRPVIASIAADPGQTYFVRTDATAVIVRSDKPDLQLAALNAGASCLIVTGGLPLLSYVNQRVAADEIPLLHTRLDTKEAIEAIEGLFGAGPFAPTEAKLRRIGELLSGVNLDSLLAKA